MVFADRLRALRKKSGLTQDEFSKQTGIGRSAVGMYESGKREPNYTTLSKVARFYHVSTDYLLGRTDTPAEPPTRKTEPSACKPHDVQQQLRSLLADLAPQTAAALSATATSPWTMSHATSCAAHLRTSCLPPSSWPNPRPHHTPNPGKMTPPPASARRFSPPPLLPRFPSARSSAQITTITQMHIKVKTSKSVEFDTFRTPMHEEISAMPPISSSSSSCLI